MMEGYNVECLKCGKKVELDVTSFQVDRWLNGEPVQEAMPNLPGNQSNMLTSGFCGECFDKICISPIDTLELDI